MNYVFWDFDGTLGCRIDGLYGRAWSASMVEAIQQLYGKSDVTMEDIAPHITIGFPWHEPEKAHVEWSSPELWWTGMRGIMARVFRQVGFKANEAERLARVAQERFLDLNTWEIYADTLPVLRNMKERGWKQFIVSNHVPELSDIVVYLGLGPYIDYLVNSADVGYEKPNPAIFHAALEQVKDAGQVWMVGDNVVADVLGAEAVGIKAILVRGRDERAKLQADDLTGAMRLLLSRS